MMHDAGKVSEAEDKPSTIMQTPWLVRGTQNMYETLIYVLYTKV